MTSEGGGSMGTNPKNYSDFLVGTHWIGREPCIRKLKSVWPGQGIRGKNKQQTQAVSQLSVMS